MIMYFSTFLRSNTPYYNHKYYVSNLKEFSLTKIVNENPQRIHLIHSVINDLQ